MIEKMYSPTELSELWSVSLNTVKNLCRSEPGVVWFGEGQRKMLRIPESVAQRVMRKVQDEAKRREGAARDRALAVVPVPRRGVH